MSVGDHEIEEPPEWDGYCSIHDLRYYQRLGCTVCADDEADRRHEEARERPESQIVRDGHGYRKERAP